ncbi:hypothetical protein CEXT_181971 [Caerostris extrusa]|uniref:Gustatory receptor n=1 Tax=Caerostris extrusa TaxID=172846 RepID=A0AAV4Y2G5_CAEEX|nr:hypothetical protein CEXT_181971 [Caerostris extrusa]
MRNLNRMIFRVPFAQISQEEKNVTLIARLLEDSKHERNICLFVLVAVYFGIVLYFSLNHSIPDKTGTFRITYNAIAVISIAFAMCLLCAWQVFWFTSIQFIYENLYNESVQSWPADQLTVSFLIVCFVPSKDVGKEFLAYRKYYVLQDTRKVASGVSPCKQIFKIYLPYVHTLMGLTHKFSIIACTCVSTWSRPQVVPNEEELHPEPPHDKPRVDLVMEQPGEELQKRQSELEQPSREEQQSPTNPIYIPTPLPSTAQLKPPEDERRPFQDTAMFRGSFRIIIHEQLYTKTNKKFQQIIAVGEKL